MPRPDFEEIAKSYKDQFDPDDPFGRSSLTPDRYAEWKADMCADQLDKECPGWRNGTYRQQVEQKVIDEWFGDDCTTLPFILRDNAYLEAHAQLFLAIPWHTVKKYIEVFGETMTPKWFLRFQEFVAIHESAVTRVIGESVDQLAEGELRNVAWNFYRDAYNFRKNYGEF